MSKGVRGAEYRPNNHSRSSCYNPILAAELLTEEEVEECSSCISNVVDRGDYALEFGIWLAEFLGKLVVDSYKTAHNSLVVS